MTTNPELMRKYADMLNEGLSHWDAFSMNDAENKWDAKDKNGIKSMYRGMKTFTVIANREDYTVEIPDFCGTIDGDYNFDSMTVTDEDGNRLGRMSPISQAIGKHLQNGYSSRFWKKVAKDD